MHLIKLRALFIIFLVCSFCACKQQPRTKEFSDAEIKQILLKMNQADVQLEEKDIDLYVEEHQLEMQQTQTGLRFQELVQGGGDSIKIGQDVTINYEVRLFNDTVCYTSEKTGARSFRVAESDVETGLHEAVLLMRVGGKARFVMPSYLAFGLSGDAECVPSKASLLYTIEILDAK